MKRILYFVVLGIVATACNSYSTGELVGVEGRRSYAEPQPTGMVPIPNGSFAMGPSDMDVTWTQNAMSRTVAVDAFWMDETEITNNEYRQFVFWVRDSIIRKELAIQGVEDYIKTNAEGDPYVDRDEEPVINWNTPLDSKKDKDGNIGQIIEDLEIYYTGADRLSFFHKEINTTKLVYNYYWIDQRQAAKASNRFKLDNSGGGNPVVAYEGTVTRPDGTQEEVTSRGSFVNKDWVLVYPDTLVWIADFTYSYNEPLTKMYFSSPSYDNYPVVGITWKQANAFCIWRTEYLNWALSRSNQPIVQDYRLPIEAEWEYAARGGLKHSMYPWGGVYLRNMSGCFIANFKPLRGNYTDDGSMYPARVAHYNGNPNEYGLYDMAGNVSEWTITAYDPSAYVFSHDMNPYYNYQAKPDDPAVMKRKVVRGGSWKDVARYLQVSTRDYQYQDSASSYIGFRCVRSYLGDN